MQVFVPNTTDFIPEWLKEKIEKYDPDFLKDKETPYIDIEVVGKGKIRAQGIWIEGETAVVATAKHFIFATPIKSVSFAGDGESSVLFSKTIDRALFKI